MTQIIDIFTQCSGRNPSEFENIMLKFISSNLYPDNDSFISMNQLFSHFKMWKQKNFPQSYYQFTKDDIRCIMRIFNIIINPSVGSKPEILVGIKWNIYTYGEFSTQNITEISQVTVTKYRPLLTRKGEPFAVVRHRKFSDDNEKKTLAQISKLRMVANSKISVN